MSKQITIDEKRYDDMANRINELWKVNTTAGWVKGQLGIIIDMIEDRIEYDKQPLSQEWLVGQLKRIKEGIRLYTDNNLIIKKP